MAVRKIFLETFSGKAVLQITKVSKVCRLEQVLVCLPQKCCTHTLPTDIDPLGDRYFDM